MLFITSCIVKSILLVTTAIVCIAIMKKKVFLIKKKRKIIYASMLDNLNISGYIPFCLQYRVGFGGKIKGKKTSTYLAFLTFPLYLSLLPRSIDLVWTNYFSCYLTVNWGFLAPSTFLLPPTIDTQRLHPHDDNSHRVQQNRNIFCCTSSIWRYIVWTRFVTHSIGLSLYFFCYNRWM